LLLATAIEAFSVQHSIFLYRSTATCGSTMLRRMCTVHPVTMLGSASFKKMSENVQGLISYTYLHFTPQAISCGKFSPAIKLKHFTSHTFCQNSPMGAAVLFLCSLDTKSHTTCLRCRSSHSAAVPPTPASRFK
jgi:hypothetical protein